MTIDPTHADVPTKAHDWVTVAVFLITEQQVEQLAAARIDETGAGRADLNMSQETLDGLDGPGCRRCGADWTIGYGVECSGPREPSQSAGQQPERSSVILPNGGDANARGLYIPGQN